MNGDVICELSLEVNHARASRIMLLTVPKHKEKSLLPVRNARGEVMNEFRSFHPGRAAESSSVPTLTILALEQRKELID